MDLIEKVKDTADEVIDKSKSVVGENTEKIHSVIDSVTGTVDSRTGHKYSDTITKVAEGAKEQVSSFGKSDPSVDSAMAARAEAPSLGDAPIADADVVED